MNSGCNTEHVCVFCSGSNIVQESYQAFLVFVKQSILGEMSSKCFQSCCSESEQMFFWSVWHRTIVWSCLSPLLRPPQIAPRTWTTTRRRTTTATHQSRKPATTPSTDRSVTEKPYGAEKSEYLRIQKLTLAETINHWFCLKNTFSRPRGRTFFELAKTLSKKRRGLADEADFLSIFEE